MPGCAAMMPEIARLLVDDVRKPFPPYTACF
jgi:hypothetical protein